MHDIKAKLTHAVTAFDRKQEERATKRKGGYHNPYALAQYLMRVDDVLADIENGAEPAAAIIAGFSAGPLRNACLTSIGAATSNADASGSYLGLPVYKPASDRI